MADEFVTRDGRDDNPRGPRARNPVRKGLVELSRARHNVTRRRHKPTPGMPAHLDRLLGEAHAAEHHYGVAVRDYLRKGVPFGDRRHSAMVRLLYLADAVDYAASYLKEAREHLCISSRILRELPGGPAPDQLFPEQLQEKEATSTEEGEGVAHG